MELATGPLIHYRVQGVNAVTTTSVKLGTSWIFLIPSIFSASYFNYPISHINWCFHVYKFWYQYNTTLFSDMTLSVLKLDVPETSRSCFTFSRKYVTLCFRLSCMFIVNIRFITLCFLPEYIKERAHFRKFKVFHLVKKSRNFTLDMLTSCCQLK